MSCKKSNISMPVGHPGECNCSDVIQAIFDGASFTPSQYEGEDFNQCILITGSNEDMKIILTKGTYIAELNLQISNDKEEVLVCIKKNNVVLPESAQWSNAVQISDAPIGATKRLGISMKNFTDKFVVTSTSDIEGCAYVNCSPKDVVLSKILYRTLRIYKIE